MNFKRMTGTSVGRPVLWVLRRLPDSWALPILQGAFRGKRWIIGSSNHSCWLGVYEYDKRRRFEEIVGSGDVVFDLGAHAGYYSLLASALVGPSGQVIAFEPLPTNIDFLKRHLLINKIGNVELIEAAV